MKKTKRFFVLLIVSLLVILSCSEDPTSSENEQPPVQENEIFVQGSTFEMGDHFNEGAEDELPVHTITLSDFIIGKYEVTYTEYIEFLNSFGVNSNGTYNGIELIDIIDSSYCAISYDSSSFYFSGSSVASDTECPVIEVTWYGAALFCNWRSQQVGLTECYDLIDWSCDFNANGFRLPTEAEWEYSARGGIHWEDNFRFSGCHLETNLSDYAWYESNSYNHTHPVGTKLPNQLNIFDMTGNVYEWCNDWSDEYYYVTSPQINPQGPTTGDSRIIRGACWLKPYYVCRVANRNDLPQNATSYAGFRYVRLFE